MRLSAGLVGLVFHPEPWACGRRLLALRLAGRCLLSLGVAVPAGLSLVLLALSLHPTVAPLLAFGPWPAFVAVDAGAVRCGPGSLDAVTTCPPTSWAGLSTTRLLVFVRCPRAGGWPGRRRGLVEHPDALVPPVWFWPQPWPARLAECSHAAPVRPVSVSAIPKSCPVSPGPPHARPCSPTLGAKVPVGGKVWQALRRWPGSAVESRVPALRSRVLAISPHHSSLRWGGLTPPATDPIVLPAGP